MEQAKLHVLLVEDDDIDTEKVTRCLRYPESPFLLTCVNTAMDALALLRAQVGATVLAKPYVILTDLQLPGISGIDFLKQLRQDARLCESTVFVLTSSASEDDQRNARHYQIVDYLLKSKLDCKTFVSLLSAYIPQPVA